jgi:predicted N-acetyltransferase YhbS
VRLSLLGPLAAAPERRGEGIGQALMNAALAAHDAAGGGPVALIGDAPYYARWGFEAAGTAGWALPGPVDRARLLVRGGEGLAVAGRLAAVAEPMPMAA